MKIIRFDNVTLSQIEYKDCKKFDGQKRVFNGADVLFFSGFARITTSQGLVDANIGDWIAKYENGNIKHIPYDQLTTAFEDYELVPVT